MENKEPVPHETPREDLMKRALKHYAEASEAIHHWSSDIPMAIKQYYSHDINKLVEENKILATKCYWQKETIDLKANAYSELGNKYSHIFAELNAAKQRINELTNLLKSINEALYIGEDLKDKEILDFYIDVATECKKSINEMLNSRIDTK